MSSSPNNKEEAISQDTVSLGMSAVKPEEQTLPVEEEVSQLEQYLDMIYYRKLQGQRLKYLSHSDVIHGRDYHHFEFYNNWFSINVNDEGITYTGVYELQQDDTVLHYAVIIPEIEMEADVYINYENEAWFEYYFEDNKLASIEYHDPTNENASNPLEGIDLNRSLALGDSIKKILNAYFYLDNSLADYNGLWEYTESNNDFHFSAELNQIGSFVFGSYCAHTAAIFDCGNPEQGGEPCYVSGYTYADTLYLSFFSCYASRLGMATLNLQKDTLMWYTSSAVDNALVPEQFALIIK